MSERTILFLNGPNLNMLGVREPHLYGHTTLADIQKMVEARGAELGLKIDFRQSNYEGDLITWIHETRDKVAGIVINPAAFTHTSIGLFDALKIATAPFIELHLRVKLDASEAFRHHSYIRPAASGLIAGLGANGYVLAVDAMKMILDSPAP
ncbi:type II 3-dehydroquinate dehydratase [Shinella sp. S4-D37]|uniref:type II 3-dehydroquinate dehydratase n=1 Tax=Shinella sp. S4-D37 TaxID=3161999 RepID=UPI003466DEB8